MELHNKAKILLATVATKLASRAIYYSDNAAHTYNRASFEEFINHRWKQKNTISDSLHEVAWSQIGDQQVAWLSV